MVPHFGLSIERSVGSTIGEPTHKIIFSDTKHVTQNDRLLAEIAGVYSNPDLLEKLIEVFPGLRGASLLDLDIDIEEYPDSKGIPCNSYLTQEESDTTRVIAKLADFSK